MYSHRNTAPKIVPALILALGAMLAPAQERIEPHRVEPRPPEYRNELRPKPPGSLAQEWLLKPTPKNTYGSFDTYPGSLGRTAEKNSFEHRPYRPRIDWNKLEGTQTPGTRPSIDYFARLRNDDPSVQKPLTRQELHELLSSGTTIVNSGDVPNGKKWLEYRANFPGQFVTHEPASANRDEQAIAKAVELGDRPLDPATAVVFNALPHETDPALSRYEQERMNISGTTRDWKLANDRINAASGGFVSHVATKQALLHELHHGYSDVVIIYAHFDGKRLYMPGAFGEAISVDEIAAVDRTRDIFLTDRVIFLAACNAAVKSPDSLVSVLLQKGIASTVLATDQTYDARDIPDLMVRLKTQTPLRQAAGTLHQYVELQVPDGLPGAPMGRRYESEVMAGE